MFRCETCGATDPDKCRCAYDWCQILGAVAPFDALSLAVAAADAIRRDYAISWHLDDQRDRYAYALYSSTTIDIEVRHGLWSATTTTRVAGRFDPALTNARRPD